ncbi:MAG: hypothetical protein L6Q84_05930 [Polyangiaceae bacterium]|nr:hypothetical protein [Polyangiaceae bacterium]
MTDDPLDLSELDPSRDRARWEARIAAVTSQALTRRQRRFSVGDQLVAWARPALAVAASLAIAAWGSAWAFGGNAPVAAQRTDPALELARWASSGELPATPQLLQLVGDAHAGH